MQKSAGCDYYFALDRGYTLDQTNDSLYDLEEALIETYKEEKPLI